MRLRMPQRGDHVVLHELVADPAVHRYLWPQPDDPLTDMFSRTLRAAGSWQLYGYGLFLAYERASGSFVGQMGVFHSWRGFGQGMDDVPEAGWIVAREHWGKGYAGEAMRAVLEWFDQAHGRRDAGPDGQQRPKGKQRIVCMIDPANTASVALALRLGFVRYASRQTGEADEVDLFERLG
ncbi:MAG: GNAT family N-acetyltransferase [Novosphingobium meiothermophilum]